MRRILRRLLAFSPISLGTVFLLAGAYVGWIFYQAAQGELIEIDVKDVDASLNLQESVVGALFGVVLDKELKLEIEPDVTAEVEFTNPLLVAVVIHEVDGALSLSEIPMSYTIEGLEPDMELGGRDSHSIQILLSPTSEETIELAKGSLDGGIDVHFVGWARVSVWGQEQTIDFTFEKVINVYGVINPL
jgi:hypothetical protein